MEIRISTQRKWLTLMGFRSHDIQEPLHLAVIIVRPSFGIVLNMILERPDMIHRTNFLECFGCSFKRLDWSNGEIMPDGSVALVQNSDQKSVHGPVQSPVQSPQLPGLDIETRPRGYRIIVEFEFEFEFEMVIT